jgi:cystathionine beta-lyase family protein involved in aluminum resistance
MPLDIICSIGFDTKEQLIAFCRSVQYASPVDGFVTACAGPMPGYSHEVIMAAGTFVQGGSLELTADAPIREPYIAYLQGGLTYEHIKLALIKILEAL